MHCPHTRMCTVVDKSLRHQEIRKNLGNTENRTRVGWVRSENATLCYADPHKPTFFSSSASWRTRALRSLEILPSQWLFFLLPSKGSFFTLEGSDDFWLGAVDIDIDIDKSFIRGNDWNKSTHLASTERFLENWSNLWLVEFGKTVQPVCPTAK